MIVEQMLQIQERGTLECNSEPRLLPGALKRLLPQYIATFSVTRKKKHFFLDFKR